MTKRHISALLLLTSFWFVACDPDNEDPIDISAPVIEVEDPENGETFPAGGAIPAHIEFKDEVALASANINIHSSADGHGHGRVLITPFSFNKNYTLNGREAEIREDIPINADATAGPYHFIVMAIDAQGNSTSFDNGSNKEVEIWISHPDMAKVVYKNASGNITDHYHGEAGKALNFYGDITANATKIESIVVRVTTEDGDGHDHDHRIASEVFYEKTFDYSTPIASVSIDKLLQNEQITISNEMIQRAGDDDIELVIIVKDQAGHIARYTAEIAFGDHDH